MLLVQTEKKTFQFSESKCFQFKCLYVRIFRKRYDWYTSLVLPSAKGEGKILLEAVHLSLSSTSKRFLRETYKQFCRLKGLQGTSNITLMAQIEEP